MFSVHYLEIYDEKETCTLQLELPLGSGQSVYNKIQRTCTKTISFIH